MMHNEVLDFWAGVGNDGWWKRDDALDREIRNRFGDLLEAAIRGELDDWQDAPDSALALIIILDQFSRNLFRDSAKAFEQDPKALTIAKVGLEKGFDRQSREDLRIFFYLPFEHSESILEQETSVKLQYSIDDNPLALKAALEHREIIQRFGRFPHRNRVLGRHTTPAEQAYLDGGGFKG
ncbi:MAG: DUF924 family protein [Pseudomonadota bacterium]